MMRFANDEIASDRYIRFVDISIYETLETTNICSNAVYIFLCVL